MKSTNCLVCQRIEAIKQGGNIHFVCELETAYVVLGDSQYYKGYTLLLHKYHHTELHQLEHKERMLFLEEMAIVSEAMYKVFKPKKLNYELLGNKYPHLHWHLFPRYDDDPNPSKPVWVVDEKLRNNDALSHKEREGIIRILKEAIIRIKQNYKGK